MSLRRYHAFGLDVASEFELPAAPAALATPEPDVIIRAGDVPDHLPGAVDILPRYQTAPGRLLLTIDGVGRYFVKDGREIVVQPEPGATPRRLQPYLVGSAFGALLQQRGDLPLHASCIRVGDVAVAFAGLKGAGKSTIAAALGQRGYDVLTDDLCALHFDGDRPMVSAGFRRIKLCPDSASALGLQARENLDGAGGEKLELSLSTPGLHERLPLHRLYVLNRRATIESTPAIVALEGASRLPLLTKYTFRRRFLTGFGRRVEHFQHCATLLRSLEIYRVRRPAGLDRLQDLVNTLELHLAGIT